MPNAGKKNWVIRPAAPEDAQELTDCMVAAYTLYLDRLDTAALPPLTIDYAHEIRHYPTWVATHDSQIVGGLTMVFGAAQATLANVAVSPDFQGQGLGKGLMVFAEQTAVSKGYSSLHLATHKRLTENKDYYIHLGWTHTHSDNDKLYFSKTI